MCYCFCTFSICGFEKQTLVVLKGANEMLSFMRPCRWIINGSLIILWWKGSKNGMFYISRFKWRPLKTELRTADECSSHHCWWASRFCLFPTLFWRLYSLSNDISLAPTFHVLGGKKNQSTNILTCRIVTLFLLLFSSKFEHASFFQSLLQDRGLWKFFSYMIAISDSSSLLYALASCTKKLEIALETLDKKLFASV